MKKLGRILKVIYWCATALGLILAVTVATYAWFTTNQTVSTDTATGRTGSEELRLEISEQGGTAFSPVEEASIVQVNRTASEQLLPVSTSDLQSFVYNSSTVEDEARSFQLVQNEERYYHGRIFLRAVADGMETGTRLALYMDTAEEAGGALVSNVTGNFLATARLGLVFDENPQSAVVFRFEDGYNSTGAQGNTVLNGVALKEGEILSWNGSSVTRAADPSVTLEKYSIQMTDTSVVLPSQPLMYMNYNQIYQVDVYFYIEGCDPDCSEKISYDGGDLHLAFYGVAS